MSIYFEPSLLAGIKKGCGRLPISGVELSGELAYGDRLFKMILG